MERENPCRAEGVSIKDSSTVSGGDPSSVSFFAEINAALQEAKDSVQPWRGVDSPIPTLESDSLMRKPVLEVRVPKEVEKGLLRVRENSWSEIIMIINIPHWINFFGIVGRDQNGLKIPIPNRTEKNSVRKVVCFKMELNLGGVGFEKTRCINKIA